MSDSTPPGISFPAFVFSLAHTAAVHLGDVDDPVTGARGVPNLPAARQMIDILVLLEVKTRGNLSTEERQLLEQIIAELAMRHDEIGRSSAGEPPRIIVP